MLEALDTIDWFQVGSCYGWSEEIPGAIRGLVSEDATVRGTALGTLWHSLIHQGTVYEASVLAVPFLLEILADPRTPDKRQLLRFLVDLGTHGCCLGPSYQTLEDHIRWQNRHTGPHFLSLEEQNPLRAWGEKVHRGFRKGLSLFLSFLSAPDPTIREEIVCFIAYFPEDHSRFSSPLITHLQTETDEYVQCALLLCLAHLHEPLPKITQLLLHYLENGETDLLRYVAAGALCTLLKEQTPEEVAHVFLEALTHPRILRPSYEPFRLLWGFEILLGEPLSYLAQLMFSPHCMLILDRLIEIYPLLRESFDKPCADFLLRFAFYEKDFPLFSRENSAARLSFLSTFNDLHPIQQTILQMLVSKETLWTRQDFDPFSDDPVERLIPVSFKPLECLGLPSTRQGLQTFVTGHTHQ